jgi:hypothetical protein
MWAARMGRISPSVEDRYDHDVDELMAYGSSIRSSERGRRYAFCPVH